jgi:adenylylsulfate kinase
LRPPSPAAHPPSPGNAAPPFAVWITGLPAAGKSALAEALAAELAARGVEAERLESDALRGRLAPGAGYDEAGRDAFYAALLEAGLDLLRRGVPVLFDATANRRRYRETARKRIARFLEVYVETPLPVCEARDPKGIYRGGREGRKGGVPGLSAPYEAPAAPEVTVRGDRETPREGARRVAEALKERGWIR